MKIRILLSVIIMCVLSITGAAIGQPLDCSYGASSQGGSGWCKLNAPMNLAEGLCMRLSIGGTADKILVRVLRDGEDPNTAVGLLGDPVSVPKDRKVIVKLGKRYSNVVQISVHGGRKPWNTPLGSQNGPATLDFVERIKCP